MPQNQTHPHTDTLTETERVDRHLWRIDVLGSKCLEWSARIGVLGSVCLDQIAWNGVLGSVCLDCSAWIGVLGLECLDWHAWISVLGSACLDRSSDRIDRRCAWIGISERSLEQRGVLERSEFVGIERSFKEESGIESLMGGERESLR